PGGDIRLGLPAATGADTARVVGPGRPRRRRVLWRRSTGTPVMGVWPQPGPADQRSRALGARQLERSRGRSVRAAAAPVVCPALHQAPARMRDQGLALTISTGYRTPGSARAAPLSRSSP